MQATLSPVCSRQRGIWKLGDQITLEIKRSEGLALKSIIPQLPFCYDCI